MKVERQGSMKKIVLIIVEGLSDETALGGCFIEYFSTAAVHVHVLHRDITTDKKSNAGNIITEVYAEIDKFKKKYHLKDGDFLRVVHIVDLDGAYIEDKNIIASDDVAHGIYYTLDAIFTSNVAGVRKRNTQKRSTINKLIPCRQIKKIPYQIFYMSSNLDHVLYNKQNSKADDKENDAHNFAMRYIGNLDEFCTFIKATQILCSLDYLETWNFIKIGQNSLKRYSNVGLIFS